ncbi:hypothetical protein Halru_0019 [Halovivax ruber XH-70]|uniref:Uncharacterized protein n=1 Tax=Halovivax ruber (strain DSM 18193 / JCM 13892 / XH-70) TaxID=797302 RepID=L0I7K9_HALRX|nr:hypothetical protein [Halovivax ruber]AGB14674.1 hypothetical protein Halru_0019 [Halovivax ruber XH-70]
MKSFNTRYGRRDYIKNALSAGSVIGGFTLANHAEAQNVIESGGPEETWDVYEENFPMDDEDAAATVVSSVLNWWGAEIVPRPGGDKYVQNFDTCCLFRNQKTDGTRGYAFEEHSLSASIINGWAEFNVAPNGSDTLGAATNETPLRDGMENVAAATVEYGLSQIAGPFDYFFSASDIYDAYDETDFDTGDDRKLEWNDSFYTGRSDMTHYSWIIVDQEPGEYPAVGTMDVVSEVDASYSMWDAKVEYRVNYSTHSSPWESTETSVSSMEDEELKRRGISKINPMRAKALSGTVLPPMVTQRAIEEERPVYWTTDLPIEVTVTTQSGG